MGDGMGWDVMSLSSSAPGPVLCAVTAFLGLCHARPGQLDSNNTMPPLPTNKNLQIVGGTFASIKEFSHQVSWQLGGRHFCGGSIISQEWVITAAHCIESSEGGVGKELALTNTSIHSGSSLLYPRGNKNQTTRVTEVHLYPSFDPISLTNDLALLKVSPPFVVDPTAGVHPIPIVTAGGHPYVNDTVTVTGWGALEEFMDRPSKLLQKVRVSVKDLEDCKRRYAEIPIVVNDSQLCASAPGKDSCSGDSGGPLTYRAIDDNKDYLVGVVSLGHGCARKEFPGVYTDLRNLQFRAFITKITGIQL